MLPRKEQLLVTFGWYAATLLRPHASAEFKSLCSVGSVVATHGSMLYSAVHSRVRHVNKRIGCKKEDVVRHSRSIALPSCMLVLNLVAQPRCKALLKIQAALDDMRVGHSPASFVICSSSSRLHDHAAYAVVA